MASRLVLMPVLPSVTLSAAENFPGSDWFAIASRIDLPERVLENAAFEKKTVPVTVAERRKNSRRCMGTSWKRTQSDSLKFNIIPRGRRHPEGPRFHQRPGNSLIKLPAKTSHLLPNLRNLPPQLRNLALQCRQAIRRSPATILFIRRSLRRIVTRLHSARQQMDIPRFLRPRLPWQNRHQRRLPLPQPLQRRDNIIQRFKPVHPFRPAPQLSRSLRPAQQQHAQHRNLPAIKVEHLLQSMFILGHAAVRSTRRPGQPFFLQCPERLRDGILIKAHHRLAIIFLVARVHQRIERERIIIRRSYIFFYQRPQHANFVGSEDIHVEVTLLKDIEEKFYPTAR